MAQEESQLEFRCPACRRRMGIDARMANREVECPACRKTFIVPKESESADGQGPARRRYQYRQATKTNDSDDGGFVAARRRAEMEEMDLTPMVDVTFLLLIFFMITASFSMQKSLEVPPPDPESQGASPIPLEQIEENSVIVRVEPEDVYFVDDRRVENPDDLPMVLTEAMATGNRSEMIIEASDDARYEAVVRVFDAGNEVGMQRIREVSTPPSS